MSERPVAFYACFLGLFAIGCGAAPRAFSPLSVRTIEWNGAHTDVGAVQAVADDASEVVVFGDRGAMIFDSGALVAVDTSVRAWRGAATIPAADGTGTWIVGVDDRGGVRRVRGRSSLEPISERYGLGSVDVLSMASFGGGVVGFAARDHGAPFLALADGKTITRYDFTTGALVGGGGVGAAVDDVHQVIRVFDPVHHRDRELALDGVTELALDGDGRLYAVTARALYAEDDAGRLTLRYRTHDDETALHGLVASGKRAWFADGGELGVIAGDVVSRTSGLSLPIGARLFGSSSGDVWTIAAGALTRFAPSIETGQHDDPAAPRAQSWTQTIQPIFARACASCHLPGGAAGVDLSTFTAWESRRSMVRARVVDAKTMPPQGHVLDDRDRATIDAWTK